MRTVLLLTLAAGGLLAGCGKEPEATAPAPAAVPQSVDITQAATNATPPPAVEAPPAAPAKVELSNDDLLGGKGRPLTEQEMMLISYGVSMFQQEKGRFPATLEEAVAARYIMRLPELPAGEKFVYNSQTGSVKVENTN